MSYWKLKGSRYGGVTKRGKRFIVDSLAKAKAKVGGTSSKRKSRKSSSSKRRVRKTARKRKKNPGRKTGLLSTRTIFKFIRLGALIAPQVPDAVYVAERKGIPMGVAQGLANFSGYDLLQNKFTGARVKQAWTPYVVAVITTHGIPKLTGMIRRLW